MTHTHTFINELTSNGFEDKAQVALQFHINWLYALGEDKDKIHHALKATNCANGRIMCEASEDGTPHCTLHSSCMTGGKFKAPCCYDCNDMDKCLQASKDGKCTADQCLKISDDSDQDEIKTYCSCKKIVCSKAPDFEQCMSNPLSAKSESNPGSNPILECCNSKNVADCAKYMADEALGNNSLCEGSGSSSSPVKPSSSKPSTPQWTDEQLAEFRYMLFQTLGDDVKMTIPQKKMVVHCVSVSISEKFSYDEVFNTKEPSKESKKTIIDITTYCTQKVLAGKYTEGADDNDTKPVTPSVKKEKLSTGAIIGLSVGGISLLVFLIFIIIYFKKKKY